MTTGTPTAVPVWETRTLSLKRPTDPPGLSTATEGIAADVEHIYVTLYHVDPADPHASTAPGHLVVLKASTGAEVKRIQVGHQPRHVALDPLRSRAYVVNYHQDSYSLSIIDTRDLVVRTTIPLGQVPLRVAVSPERNRVYVSNWFQGKVHVISGPNSDGTGEGLLASLTVGKGTLGVGVDDASDRVYATIGLTENGSSISQVVPINTLNNAVGAPVTIPPFRADAEDVVVDPVSRHVFVINLGIAADGSTAPKITVFDGALNLIDNIPLPRDASHLAFDPKTRQVFAVIPEGVVVIDAVTRKVTSTIPTPLTARGVAVAMLGPQVFIGNSPNGLLTIATPIGAGPHDLALTRPDDLLQLDFDFVNLRLDTSPSRPARLVRVDLNQPALIVVHFPPQHLNERVFPNDPGQPVFRPAQARLAGPTRLAFRLPSGLNEIPYTVESLLDWKRFEPSLAPTALPPLPTAPPTIPPIAEPAAAQTAIELPYRLVLSPDSGGVWEHAARPVTRQGVTELWHTRLRIAAQPNADPALRAIWSPDRESVVPFPFTSAISADQRKQIVRLTADFTLAAKSNNALPRPIRASQFMLTPLGGYLKSRGSWSPLLSEGLNVIGWRHAATLGRDHSVRVAELGFLLPFGHRAVKIIATEREISTAPPNTGTTPQPAATLRQREFLVIEEPEKRFDGLVLNAFAGQGREMPLRSVRILLGETPKLAAPIVLPSTGGAHWVQVLQGTQAVDFQFPLAATDIAGQTVEFSAPMIFVPGTVVEANGDQMEEALRRYNTDALNDSPRRTARVANERIAYAPRPSATSDDTSFITERLLFGLDEISPILTGSTPFLPRIEEAAVHVPALEGLIGAALPAVEVRFFDKYLQGVLDGPDNRAAIFMTMQETVQIKLPVELAGGLAKTDLNLRDLSRTLGPLPNKLRDLADGTFNPAEIFGALDSKLLGVISLKDIISGIFEAGQIPKFLSETRLVNNLPDAIVTRLDWNPTLKDVGPFKAGFGGQDAKLTVTTTIEQKIPQGVPSGPPPQPTYTVVGTLTNFRLEFVEVLSINFKSLTFTSRSGQKADVKTTLHLPPVGFAGALGFLDELRRQIPDDLFGSLPGVDVTPRGVAASYSLALPPLAFGAFTLQNVIMGANLELPFVDEPARVRFTFGTRNNPFNLSVLAIGGGGFLGIDVAMDRIVGIEAALEMGGNAALNLGVARAAVWAMGGIYFRLAEDALGVPRVDLTASIRYGGSASVLGLITVSVEFYLALTYEPDQNLLHGQAQMTVKVKIAFFSKSVQLKVERTFEGPDLSNNRLAFAPGDGGASFGDMLDEAHWQQYATAFA